MRASSTKMTLSFHLQICRIGLRRVSWPRASLSTNIIVASRCLTPANFHNRLILTDLDLEDFTFDTFDYAGTSTPEYGVALRLLWTKDGQSGEIHIPNMAEGVDLFEFADGSTLGDIRPNWLREHYANRPAYANDERDRIDGTDNDDFIQTTDTGTRLYTYGGNGDDTIIGSDTGQDDLRGGNGDDYL